VKRLVKCSLFQGPIQEVDQARKIDVVRLEQVCEDLEKEVLLKSLVEKSEEKVLH